jgi:hypothetical protein
MGGEASGKEGIVEPKKQSRAGEGQLASCVLPPFPFFLGSEKTEVDEGGFIAGKNGDGGGAVN